MTTSVRVLDFVGIAWTSLRVVGVQSPRGAGSSVTKVRASSHQMRRPTPPASARRERTLGGGCGGGICTVTVRCVVRRNSAQCGLNRPRGEMSLPDAVCCLAGFTRQVRFGPSLRYGQATGSATSKRIRRLCQRTWTTATRWIPPGLSTLTSSPARWPEIAAPKGESSEIR